MNPTIRTKIDTNIFSIKNSIPLHASYLTTVAAAFKTRNYLNMDLFQTNPSAPCIKPLQPCIEQYRYIRDICFFSSPCHHCIRSHISAMIITSHLCPPAVSSLLWRQVSHRRRARLWPCTSCRRDFRSSRPARNIRTSPHR